MVLWYGRYNGFHLSRDLARPHDQGAKWLHGQKPLKISHHPSKFGGQGHYGSWDIIVSVCHVISQERVIKAGCPQTLEKLENSIYFENVLEKLENGMLFLLLRWKNWKSEIMKVYFLILGFNPTEKYISLLVNKHL